MKIRRHLAAATLLAASTALAAPAFAHESRIVPASTGKVRVTVGFYNEPAFEDFINGLDLFLYTWDSPCPIDTSDFFGNPIDTRAGDTVTLKAEAIYLDKSAPPTGPNGSQPPTAAKILKTLLISDKSPVSAVFGESGNYHSSYRPTHPGSPPAAAPHSPASTASPASASYPGAYGFHVYGTVEAKQTEYTCDADSSTPTTKTIAARTASIDTYWVCDTPGVFPGDTGRFSCIQPLQSFPGKPEDGYEPNKPYSSRGGHS